MLRKDFFFKSKHFKSSVFNKNLNKTKIIFNNFLSEISNSKIPMLESYQKGYAFDFSKKTTKIFSKHKNIVIIGMGGSILGAKSIYSFFKKKIKKNIFFFDNLDPNLYIKFKKYKFFKKSCFIVVSKSGNTLETIVNLQTVFSKKSIRNRLVVITEIKNSKLMITANKLKAHVVEHKNFIGGRYSVLSEVGMFPAALMGLKIEKFQNLKQLIKNKNFASSLINNVASLYTLNKKNIRNSVILNYNSQLNDLCLWYQQLTGESLGKKGKGIMPIVSTCPKDHHSLLQLYLDGPRDNFFTFFTKLTKKSEKVESIIQAQCEATKNIFRKKQIPFRHFEFKKNDERELGSLFTFLVLETILLARLMNINPYNQPAVEEVKNETRKILAKKSRSLAKNYF